MNEKRLPDSYFSKVYEHDRDPWGFSTRPYEHRKYDITVASLTRSSYNHAFEPGCSIGILSARLAARCKRLTSMEPVATIAATARDNLKQFPESEVLIGAVPECWPPGSFDLIIFSEMLYYLTAEGLKDALQLADGSLTSDGQLLVVHYRGATDYPLSGDAVHDYVAEFMKTGFVNQVSHTEKDFRLDMYEKVS